MRTAILRSATLILVLSLSVGAQDKAMSGLSAESAQFRSLMHGAPSLPLRLTELPLSPPSPGWKIEMASSARELLIPFDEVAHLLSERGVAPQAVLALADSFSVSLQVAANQIVSVLARWNPSCSLWSFENHWPMPVWWAGVKTNVGSDLAKLERLLRTRIPTTQIWDSFAARKRQVKVQIALSEKLNYCVVLVVPPTAQVPRTHRESKPYADGS